MIGLQGSYSFFLLSFSFIIYIKKKAIAKNENSKKTKKSIGPHSFLKFVRVCLFVRPPHPNKQTNTLQNWCLFVRPPHPNKQTNKVIYNEGTKFT